MGGLLLQLRARIRQHRFRRRKRIPVSVGHGIGQRDRYPGRNLQLEGEKHVATLPILLHLGFQQLNIRSEDKTESRVHGLADPNRVFPQGFGKNPAIFHQTDGVVLSIERNLGVVSLGHRLRRIISVESGNLPATMKALPLKQNLDVLVRCNDVRQHIVLADELLLTNIDASDRVGIDLPIRTPQGLFRLRVFEPLPVDDQRAVGALVVPIEVPAPAIVPGSGLLLGDNPEAACSPVPEHGMGEPQGFGFGHAIPLGRTHTGHVVELIARQEAVMFPLDVALEHFAVVGAGGGRALRHSP